MSQVLDRLVGEEISGVCFVVDYVEFHFNGPVLRAIANPIMRRGFEWWQFPDPGSRDALCGLIGKRVELALEQPERKIEVVFLTGETLQIPLDVENTRGGESAHFVTPSDGAMSVW